MGDYRVKISVSNDRLKSAIEQAGYKSTAEFTRAHELSSSSFARLLNMKEPAYDKNGDLRAIVIKVCEVLNKEPDQLFNQQQLSTGLATNTATISLDQAQLEQLTHNTDPMMMLSNTQLVNTIDAVLDQLTTDEQQVVRMRFGIDGDEMTYAAIGEVLGKSASRVQQLESKGVNKLRGWRCFNDRVNPIDIDLLKSFIKDE